MIPIKFKEFASNPVVGTLFVVLVAIGYLYVDVRSTFQGQAKNQDVKIEKLETRLDKGIGATQLAAGSLALFPCRVIP